MFIESLACVAPKRRHKLIQISCMSKNTLEITYMNLSGKIDSKPKRRLSPVVRKTQLWKETSSKNHCQ